MVGCCRAQKEAEKEKARLEKEADKERVKQEKEAARKEKEVSTEQADTRTQQHQQIAVRLLQHPMSAMYCAAPKVVMCSLHDVAYNTSLLLVLPVLHPVVCCASLLSLPMMPWHQPLTHGTPEKSCGCRLRERLKKGSRPWALVLNRC